MVIWNIKCLIETSQVLSFIGTAGNIPTDWLTTYDDLNHIMRTLLTDSLSPQSNDSFSPYT